MSEYRKCDVCGARLSVDEVMCECGNMVIHLPVLNDDEDSAAVADDDGTCKSCGMFFPADETACPFCGAVRRENVEPSEQLRILSFIDQGGHKKIVKNGMSIYGRAGEMGTEITARNANYVSERHLEIEFNGTRIFARDISRNGTFVNGKKLIKGEKRELFVGDTVVLGGVSAELDRYSFTMVLKEDK